MSKRFSMWLPGHAVAAQDPKVNATIVRYGGNALVPSGPISNRSSEEWFQFAIPTPTVAMDHGHPNLARVMVLFASDENLGPAVTRVDVWHGNGMVRQGHDVNLAGERYASQIYAGENIFDVNVGGIGWGVGVSIRVENNGAGSDFSFISAGADFDFPGL
jgi:hypothetical protein